MGIEKAVPDKKCNVIILVSVFIITLALSFGIMCETPVLAAAERITLQDQEDSDNPVPEADFREITSDGGQIILSYTLSFEGGNKDIHVVKKDKDNVIEWEKTFGGSGDDEARHIQQTDDDGYILTGYTGSQGAGGRDLYVLKLNKWGDKSWDACFGGVADDEGSFIQETATGRYVAVGYTKSKGDGDADAYAVGLDRKGKRIFERTYGGEQADYACSVQALNTGGFILTGTSKSFGGGSWDMYVVKCSGSGYASWERAIGGSESYVGAFAQVSPSSEFLVVGYTHTPDAQQKMCLVKLNSSGHLLWENIVSEQTLYGEAMALTLSGANQDEGEAENDNALPPPEVPQQKYSRSKAIDRDQ
ncbi:MAG: hypothetical protein U9N81_12390 [Bacillota bacterium]|nr:hypothetical protein [Bacillota bacterium]